LPLVAAAAGLPTPVVAAGTGAVVPVPVLVLARVAAAGLLAAVVGATDATDATVAVGAVATVAAVAPVATVAATVGRGATVGAGVAATVGGGLLSCPQAARIAPPAPAANIVSTPRRLVRIGRFAVIGVIAFMSFSPQS